MSKWHYVTDDTKAMNLPNGVLIRIKDTKELGGIYSHNVGSVSISNSMEFIPDIYWDSDVEVFLPIESLPENHSTKVDK